MAFAPHFKLHSIILQGVIGDTVEVQWMIKKLISLVSYITFTDVCLTSINSSQISTFLAHYRTSFPHATILPKMHILEDHVIPWLRQWHVGAGLMGEQGAESVHTHLHSLERNFSGISNELDRLFNMYNIETCPQLLELRPQPKKRKTEEVN